MSSASDLLKHACAQTFRENTERVIKCLNRVEEKDIWVKPNEVSNSFGNQILHLCGNIRQYAISGLGGAPDIRKRDLEFTTTAGYSKSELITMLEETIAEAVTAIEGLSEEWLKSPMVIQGFQFTGVSALVHVTEHYSYHLGQIAFWAKQITNQEVGFFDGVDLNSTNDR